ncbi:hypothetical protein ACFV1C_20750 [Streptomyces sp. NPDC059605]|uniref:hypothetical protein n=1 Tax=unclassified Streptomyces TaxID=2593676 RepID=UPI0036875220
MRRAAAEIGMPTMSLHHHVANEEQLIVRMVDAAFASEPPSMRPPKGRRGTVSGSGSSRCPYAVVRGTPNMSADGGIRFPAVGIRSGKSWDRRLGDDDDCADVPDPYSRKHPRRRGRGHNDGTGTAWGAGMDAPDLAAMAAQVLSAAASGAANTAVSDLVRGRLSRSDRGRAALDELVDSPDDPETIRRVQDALAEEISGDTEFAGRLAVLLHASSQQHTGSVVPTGSTTTRSQIALGPLTINNTPAGRLSLGAGIVLVVLTAVLAAYGVVRLFDNTDDPPRNAPPVPGTTRSADRAAALPPTTDTVRQILPDRSSMDIQEYPWVGAPEVKASAAGLPLCRAAPECERNATAAGVVEFGRGENEGENLAEFLVLAFPDADAAHRAYNDIVQDYEEADRGYNNFRKATLEPRGEESQGFDPDGTDTRSNPTPSMVNRALIFRQGAFIGMAHQLDDPTEQRGTRILGLSAVLADRIAKADAGRTP